VNAFQHEQLIPLRHRDASSKARQSLLIRAARADRRATRAAETARVVNERLALAVR